MNLGRYTKAVVGGLVAAYAVFQIARGETSPGGGELVLNEWLDIIATWIIVGAGVWAVPNTPQQKM